MKLAAIDIGTNSVKLSVVRRIDGRLRSLHEETIVTRPGEGVLATGRISAAAMERTLRVIRRYQRTARKMGAEKILVGATETFRRARNGADFAEQLAALGLHMRIIDRKTEAECAFLGATSFSGIRTAIVADLGGGTVQIVPGRDGKVLRFAALPIGVVFLTERFLKHDPPLLRELDAMRRYVRKQIRTVSARGVPPTAPLIGVGGSAAALVFATSGRSRFEVEAYNGRPLAAKTLDRLFERLAAISAEQRRRQLRIDPGRADVIVAGALVLQELLRRFKRDMLTVCTYGVRHGMILKHLTSE